MSGLVTERCESCRAPLTQQNRADEWAGPHCSACVAAILDERLFGAALPPGFVAIDLASPMPCTVPSSGQTGYCDAVAFKALAKYEGEGKWGIWPRCEACSRSVARVN